MFYPSVATTVSTMGFYIYKLAGNLAFYTFNISANRRSISLQQTEKYSNTMTANLCLFLLRIPEYAATETIPFC